MAPRFGSGVAQVSSVGTASGFSRGQGFTVGNRVGILSSERRADGLSIRFTTMFMGE